MRIALVELLDASVTTAGNADEAVDRLRGREYDLILADYSAIWGDGEAVLDFLRAERPSLVDKLVFFSDEHGAARWLHHKVIDRGVAPEQFERDLRGLSPELWS